MTNVNAESDAVLMGRLVNGEADAARILVGRHSPALRRFVSRAGLPPAEVDDVLQDTWLRVVRSAGRYDPLQPFTRWLFAIAMNRIRTRWERDRGELIELREMTGAEVSPDVLVDDARRATAVRSVVLSLPPHLADTILLRFFEELSEREVAQRLGIPVGTVKSRIHHAIRRLRTDIERIFHV